MSDHFDARSLFGCRASTYISFAALLVCGALVACKPQEIPVACTPLPIVDGYETAMTEGDKMRLRVPKHTSSLTTDCKQIKDVELRYYWHKGELVWNDGTQPTSEFSKETLSHPIKIFLTEFKSISDIAPPVTKPWQFEGAVRHYKYPLEFYPKFYWAGPDQPPVKSPPDVRWGVVGTKDISTPYLRTTACDIGRGGSKETQADVVKGEFHTGYSDAKCRGGISTVKGDKVAFGMIDVWANNAHDIDRIYGAVIAKIQTYIQE
jgi:hypothetical protein